LKLGQHITVMLLSVFALIRLSYLIPFHFMIDTFRRAE